MKSNSAVPSAAKINHMFMAMLPELESRAAAMARRCRDRQAAADDVLGNMFLNFAGSASRGTWLRPPALAWAALQHLKARSLITHPYPSRCRDRTFSLDDRHINTGLASRIATALTTSERDDPAVTAAVRIDWHAFSKTLDRRHRRILLELATGEMKANIAASLKISRGRLSQILEQIAAEITGFWGAEGLPGAA